MVVCFFGERMGALGAATLFAEAMNFVRRNELNVVAGKRVTLGDSRRDYRDGVAAGLKQAANEAQRAKEALAEAARARAAAQEAAAAEARAQADAAAAAAAEAQDAAEKAAAHAAAKVAADAAAALTQGAAAAAADPLLAKAKAAASRAERRAVEREEARRELARVQEAARAAQEGILGDDSDPECDNAPAPAAGGELFGGAGGFDSDHDTVYDSDADGKDDGASDGAEPAAAPGSLEVLAQELAAEERALLDANPLAIVLRDERMQRIVVVMKKALKLGRARSLKWRGVRDRAAYERGKADAAKLELNPLKKQKRLQ